MSERSCDRRDPWSWCRICSWSENSFHDIASETWQWRWNWFHFQNSPGLVSLVSWRKRSTLSWRVSRVCLAYLVQLPSRPVSRWVRWCQPFQYSTWCQRDLCFCWSWSVGCSAICRPRSRMGRRTLDGGGPFEIEDWSTSDVGSSKQGVWGINPDIWP